MKKNTIKSTEQLLNNMIINIANSTLEKMHHDGSNFKDYLPIIRTKVEEDFNALIAKINDIVQQSCEDYKNEKFKTRIIREIVEIHTWSKGKKTIILSELTAYSHTLPTDLSYRKYYNRFKKKFNEIDNRLREEWLKDKHNYVNFLNLKPITKVYATSSFPNPSVHQDAKAILNHLKPNLN